ncbi:MAG TPA: adenylate/guanylate cyclase domain-containing protein, partial [Kofleriaceae bacterium]|nr:adenylate/guanylate cyclase domain-containing protein [Kofleriaceae bacterium]
RKLIAGAAAGLAVGLVAAVAALSRPLFLERGELWTQDVRARGAADYQRASPDIVIIDIGEQDIEDVDVNMLQTWPWPREVYAEITTHLALGKPKAIVYDWLFQDRGAYSMEDAEKFAAAMRKAGNVVIGLAASREPQVRLPSEGPFAAPLRRFATRAEAEKAAVRLSAWNVRSFLVGDGPTELWFGGKRVAGDVLAIFGRVSGIEELADLFVDPGDPNKLMDAPKVRELSLAEQQGEYTAVEVIVGRDGLTVPGGDDLAAPERRGIDPPLAVIAAAPAHTGNVYQDPDADGIMRRHAPLVRHDDRLFPSLALAALLVAEPGAQPRIDDGELVVGEHRVPLDGEGRMVLRFRGVKRPDGKRVYTHVPAYEVIRSRELVKTADYEEEEAAKATDAAEAAKHRKAAAEARAQVPLPSDKFAGKYVIISASGQSLRDIRITPVSKTHEGAEINANALDNLLAGDSIRRSSPLVDALITLLLAVGAALAITALWSAFRRLWMASVAVLGAITVLLVGYWWLADWLYGGRGLWVAVSVPGGAAVASAFAALLVTVAGERRNRRFVQEAFGRYTSADLVREIVEHPEYLSLEWGEQREMSVYFSDIAGFTTISEGLVPAQLVALLNDYLTQMTDLVMQHGGYVDKYIGDALMAIWGAPIRDKDHAVKAVRCAIAMRKKSDELRAGWKERYGHEVFARAGVNSGEAVVGNMGSRQKYNYTVMGDMVNLASRLEGANKAYGTFLMIGEITAAKVDGVFALRELDLIAVKGKERPVRIFEVLEETGAVPAPVLRAVDKFGEGLALYRKREFAAAITAFEAAGAEHPDPPSAMYIDRCRHFLDDPPEEDWDGVWRMKEK